MSHVGERKAAVLLAALHGKDRRKIMAQLPDATAHRLRLLIRQVDAMSLQLDDVLGEVLEEGQQEALAIPSPSILEVGVLAQQLPPPWFALASSAWAMDRTFLAELLEPAYASEVRRAWENQTPVAQAVLDSVRKKAAEIMKKPEVSA